MGGSVSKSNRKRRFSEKYVTNLKEKVMDLQEEIKDVMYEREKESRSYEREIMVFTFKEADWKQEGKRMREEVKMLRKMVEEKEERIRDLEEKKMGGEKSKKGSRSSDEKEWEQMGTKLLVEQMKEERARRDEAVEKWKHLYLAIKTELDDLIQRTYHGDGLYWKGEEKEIQMETMKKELQDKEETIKALKSHLDSLEQEKYKKEREFDLLRQSLRIMNGKKCSVHKNEKIKKSRLGT